MMITDDIPDQVYEAAPIWWSESTFSREHYRYLLNSVEGLYAVPYSTEAVTAMFIAQSLLEYHLEETGKSLEEYLSE